jgi:predicted RNA-binding protein YlqC (UPF0109 family)
MREVFEVETERIAKPMPAEDLRLLRERIKCWMKETVMLMVDFADEVKVVEGSIRDTDTQLKIAVHHDDTGKVIGKTGRNVRSLRICLMAISRSTGHNFTLDVVDGNEEIRAERLARVIESHQ